MEKRYDDEDDDNDDDDGISFKRIDNSPLMTSLINHFETTAFGLWVMFVASSSCFPLYIIYFTLLLTVNLCYDII